MEAKQQGREATMRGSAGGTKHAPIFESFLRADTVTGITVLPKSVLIFSLMFIAAVVVLHFFDKLKL